MFYEYETVASEVIPPSTEPILEPASTVPEAQEQEKLSYLKRLGNVVGAAKADYRESDSKLKGISLGLGTVALQGLDRARASVVFVPTVAVDVLKNTHSPTEAAVAAGLAFGGWCLAVGGATTEGLDQYPKAVTEFEKSFPGVVGFFEDALPGFDKPSPEQRKASLARRAGQRILAGIHRGYTVTGIGTVAYVSTAAAKGKSRSETHKLNLNASLDGGIAVGAIVFGVGEAIVQLAHSHPVLAERIQNDASNIKLWYAVAGVMMAQQFITNRLKRRHTPKHKAEAQAASKR